MKKKVFVVLRITLLVMAILSTLCCCFHDDSYSSNNNQNQGHYGSQDGTVLPEEFELYIENKDIAIEYDNGPGIFVKLVKSTESEVHYFITETKSGKVISRAFQKLADGSEKIIEDINGFLLDTNVKSIRIETENAISIEEVSLNYADFKGYWIGKTYTFELTPYIYPQNASNQYVKYFSSNSSVAFVDRNGKVTIKNSGTATICVLTLDGALKSTCLVKIIDGRSQLKDSVGYVDYDKYELVGNRFDDLTNDKSEYNQIAKSTKTNQILIGGNTSNGTSGTYVTLMYGEPYQNSTSFQGNIIQTDEKNKYVEENILDVEYNSHDGLFYVVTVNRNDTSVNSWNTEIYVFEEQYDSLTNSYFLLYKKSFYEEGIIQQITFKDNRTYCWGTIEEEDKLMLMCLDLISSKIKWFSVSSIWVNNAYYDETYDRFVLCGCNEVSSYLAIIGGNLDYDVASYSSIVGDSEFNDVTWIDETHFVAVGSGSKSNSNSVAFIQSFLLIDDNLVSTNYKLFESNETSGTINLFSNVYYENGCIGVIGTTSGIVETKDDSFLGNILGASEQEFFVCGTVSMFSTSLQFISGHKYFSMQSGYGKLSMFSNSLSLGNGTYICVGVSNYKSGDKLTNGYIQYGVELFK